MKFKLTSDFKPEGDQPGAIEKLADGIKTGRRHQTLLGVTGSGKTFTMANVIERVQRPTLVISHNKTLAAQLYGEFKEFFPENAVHFFVSYYDYYQPEAYIPRTDTYIEKDASINEEIDRLRHASTSSLFTRKDVIVVASVSCIYGIGEPEEYLSQSIELKIGDKIKRNDLLKDLIDIQFERNDIDFKRGTIRARGDILEIFPPYEESTFRIEFFGDTIEAIKKIDVLTGEVKEKQNILKVFPAKHFATPKEKILAAISEIKKDLAKRIEKFKKKGKLLEAQRLEQRTNFDIEMLSEAGYCSGIENYSLYLSGRKVGEPPFTLLDYFKFNSKNLGLKDDFLTIIDESHMTVPQIRGMYNGDRSRKETLVEFGFRLPSALDNRPFRFEEFVRRVGETIFVSATPAEYELRESGGAVVEQIIRPTGLVDPGIEVRPAGRQVDDLLGEIRARAEAGERVLVTTLTKRMAEDLTEHYEGKGLRVRYLHSDIDTMERVRIIRELRLGECDTLIGINLLREGLDIPEVSLVAILDADKEGFLRSARSLVQTFGRAARNLSGKVILYADRTTGSMREAITETERRREKQLRFNEEAGITPETVRKNIAEPIGKACERDYVNVPAGEEWEFGSARDLARELKRLRREMERAAKQLDFERAAEIRDRLLALERVELAAR